MKYCTRYGLNCRILEEEKHLELIAQHFTMKRSIKSLLITMLKLG